MRPKSLILLPSLMRANASPFWFTCAQDAASPSRQIAMPFIRANAAPVAVRHVPPWLGALCGGLFGGCIETSVPITEIKRLLIRAKDCGAFVARCTPPRAVARVIVLMGGISGLVQVIRRSVDGELRRSIERKNGCVHRDSLPRTLYQNTAALRDLHAVVAV